MKKQIIPGCVMLAVSLVIAIGSRTFLGPCVHDDGVAGACHWAGCSLLGLGLLVSVLSVFALLLPKARLGLYLSTIAVSVLGMLTPGTLIGLCRMSSMRCRAVMQPAMIILFAVVCLAALCGTVICGRNGKG